MRYRPSTHQRTRTRTSGPVRTAQRTRLSPQPARHGGRCCARACTARRTHPPVVQGAAAFVGPHRWRRAAGRARARSWRHRAKGTSRTLTIWKYRESARPMVSTESHLMFDVSCFAWSIMLLFGNHPSRSASPDPARRPGRPASRVGRSARPGPTSPPPSGPERVGRSERTGSKPGSRARPGRSVGDVKCKINFAPPR